MGADPGDEIGSIGHDYLIAAMGARQFGLGIGADNPDDPRAQALRPLGCNQTDTARRGIEQDGIARPNRVTAFQQIPCREPFQHCSGGCLFAYGGR